MNNYVTREKLKISKGEAVNRIRNSNYSVQKKNDKRTNNDLQNITH